MELPINTDPQDLNKNMLGGRKWWQYLCIAISFVIAIVFTIVLRGKLNVSEPPRINVVHDSSENKKNTKRKGR